MNKIKNPQNAFLKEAHKIKISGATYDKYGFLELIAEEIFDESQSTGEVLCVDEKGKASHLEYFVPFYVNQHGEASKQMGDVYCE